jgi:pimeloyl-ACP methyl ester carboxylesterase
VAAAACVVGVVLVFAVSPVWGQAKKPAAKVPEKTFEDVTLDTKDGVITIATYYPGPEQKTTVPLILVHDWDGNRTELHSLAMFLQQELQHAVIVPDLRGHGVSLRQRGVDEQINREKMNRAAIESAWLDIEAAKAYLMQRNNEGKLNIEQLGVLGTGFGATLAIKWAVRDWNFTSTPALKNGQDVKALILISPRQSFKGVTANQELKSNWLSFMSVLTIVGTQDAARYADAKRMHKAFEAFHRDAPPGVVHLYEADTALQGVDLIMDRNLGVPNLIKDCIRARLVDRGADLPWRDRTSPLK